MSPEEAKELAAKYRALAEFFAAKAAGKSLQLSWTKFSEGNGITVWETTEYFPTPDSDLSKWRVKPDPRTVWLADPNGSVLVHVAHTPEQAEELRQKHLTVTEWQEVQP